MPEKDELVFGGAIQEGSYRMMSALINLAWPPKRSRFASYLFASTIAE